MNSNLLFDFSVNRENNTIHIKREFNAGLELVWQAWTTAELLDQWWAPKPWWVETKTMDCRDGGLWHYAMKGPAGETFWSMVDYISVETEKFFKSRDCFCDEHGVTSPDSPKNSRENNFSVTGNTVVVDMLYTFDTLAHLEQLIAMGFKGGFSIGLNQLDELLATLTN